MDEFNNGDRVRLAADEYEDFDDYGLEIGMLGQVVRYAGAGYFTVLVDGFEEEWDFAAAELEAV